MAFCLPGITCTVLKKETIQTRTTKDKLNIVLPLFLYGYIHCTTVIQSKELLKGSPSKEIALMEKHIVKSVLKGQCHEIFDFWFFS